MSPSLIIRALWFLFIGIWLAPLALLAAWVCNVTIVGLPLGIWIINRAPLIATLKTADEEFLDPEEGVTQHSLVVRAVYFLLVGWWLSLLWTIVAIALLETIIGLPVAAVMFSYLPYVTSLQKFH